jgi:two-component system alkaline phosphatase synthesis response regulator PhoP
VVTVTDRLASEGYEVDSVVDGEGALRKAANRAYDLIVLDVMLPGMDGFQVCRELREKKIQTPILMLTARSELVDKVVGLKLGADDYLTKPFEMAELLARIEALLRRGSGMSGGPDDAMLAGDVRVDLRRAQVWRGDEEVELTPLELKLLRYFLEHRGEVVTRDELLDNVWGYDAMPVTRTVDVHVASLRQKIEEKASHPELILTVRGLGYRFVG